MNLILEMKGSPSAGKRLVVAEGRQLLLGRAASADFSFPEEQFLSSRHCSFSATPEGCRVTDLGSSNGTLLNGVRIKEASLKDGDQLVAGHITFLVHLVEKLEAESAPVKTTPSAHEHAARGSASGPPFRFSHWSLSNIPTGWELIEGYGIRDANQGAFPSTVICSQEMLSSEVTLDQYIKNQLLVIRTNMPQARPKETAPTSFPPASEAAWLEIELPTPDGREGILHQFYARFGSRVGIVTFTTLANELPRLQPLFDSIRSGLSFRAE